VDNKGNEFAIEALKQLLTLAAAILALTITFLKDALGDARAEAALTWLVPAAWLLFVAVVWLAWVAIADAARQIGTAVVPAGGTAPYAFARGTRTRRLAWLAQWTFLTALAALVVFAIVNLPLFFRAPAPRAPDGAAAAAADLRERLGREAQRADDLQRRMTALEHELARQAQQGNRATGRKR
jgi:hypothetical protein